MSQLRTALLSFLLLLAGSALAQVGVNQPQGKLATITLSAGGHKIAAEVAATDKTREVGMMLRKKMGKDEGMLFVFPEPQYYAMWMKNTLLPLSVAFMDDKGVIVSIHEMLPQTETTHQAAGPAIYALEMNAGWFTANKVKVGDKVGGVEKAPKAK